MKTRSLVTAFSLLAAAFFASPPPVAAQVTNVSDAYGVTPVLQNLFAPRPGFGNAQLPATQTINLAEIEPLLTNEIPRGVLLESCSGAFYSLANPRGDQVQIPTGAPETPQPVTNAFGYLDSPTMNFLGRQKMKATNEQNAVTAVQLYLSLAHGTDYMRQKLYHARRFDDCWIVTVDHDSKNHPGNVQAVMPFELQVDSDSSIAQFRERRYNYPGSARMYTNTVRAVYKREKQIQAGRFDRETFDRELEKAWQKEQDK
jgi:hypothetical protein